jgi:hypothetical protein
MEIPDVDERIILKRIVRKSGVGGGGEENWTGSGQEPLVGSCSHGHAPSTSMKDGEFTGQLSDSRFLKKHYSPWIHNFISAPCDSNVMFQSCLPKRKA